MTVADVISRAGVSRKTFYDAFANREECLLALLEDTFGRAVTVATEVYLDRGDWREGVRSALARLLFLMDREPALARLWLIESLNGGEKALEYRAQVLETLADAINDGRHASGVGKDPPKLVAEMVVGGVVAALQANLLRSPQQPLMDLLGRLMYMITLPYRGERVARHELANSVPPAGAAEPRRAPMTDHDPLEGLKMRLTYRTVRVLVAIEDSPGTSNREVAGASGIADQGQISKLLGRLARLQLIENHGLGQSKGGANAWHLTARGAQVVRATRPGRAGLT